MTMQSNNTGEQTMIFTYLCRVCDRKFTQHNKKSLEILMRMHNKKSHQGQKFVISDRLTQQLIVNKERLMTDNELRIHQENTM